MPRLIPFVSGLAVTPAAGSETAIIPPDADATKPELLAWLTAVGVDATTKSSKAELRALVDDLVDASDGVPGVGSVALGDDGVADGEQLVDGEPPPLDASDEDTQPFGHED